MSIPAVRQLVLLYLVWCLGCWSCATAESYGNHFSQWEDGITLRKVPDVQSDEVGDIELADQNEEEAQHLFKRFLFHYSKAHKAGHQVSHSVHPLMRLSPKLTQRKKKQLLLLKIRDLTEGML